MKSLKYLVVALLTLQLIGCNEGAENNSSDEILENSDVFNGEQNNPHSDGSSEMTQIREVTVLEVLPTSNYQYLKVSENGGDYWVAVNKTDIEIGKNYILIGGMEQTNFKSKELDRVFDNLLLVTQIVPARAKLPKGEAEEAKATEVVTDVKEMKNRAEGTVLISELIKNAKSYGGKTVRVQGICTKVNEGIMSKNWAHINDGTNAGFDFVTTTTETVAVGKPVIIEGTVALDKDFGAGYKYSLMLENCRIIK
jgi:hypothetical protein